MPRARAGLALWIFDQPQKLSQYRAVSDRFANRLDRKREISLDQWV